MEYADYKIQNSLKTKTPLATLRSKQECTIEKVHIFYFLLEEYTAIHVKSHHLIPECPPEMERLFRWPRDPSLVVFTSRFDPLLLRMC